MPVWDTFKGGITGPATLREITSLVVSLSMGNNQSRGVYTSCTPISPSLLLLPPPGTPPPPAARVHPVLRSAVAYGSLGSEFLHNYGSEEAGGMGVS